MKIVEQICPQCGKRLDNGTTWTEENKCPQCGTEVVLYDPGKTYRFFSLVDCDKERKELLENGKNRNVKFIGKTNNGYWLTGPVEIER